MEILKPCPFCGGAARMLGGGLSQDFEEVWCTSNECLAHARPSVWQNRHSVADQPTGYTSEERGHETAIPGTRQPVECSGNPSNCPENEGYGCCKPNPKAGEAPPIDNAFVAEGCEQFAVTILKPCPFCGEAPDVHKTSVYIACINPKCGVKPVAKYYHKLPQAAKDWNTRAIKREAGCDRLDEVARLLWNGLPAQWACDTFDQKIDAIISRLQQPISDY